MNLIEKKTLQGYVALHTDAAHSLAAWSKIVEHSAFRDIHAVRAVLPTADFADPYTIFNIKGNHYRLITIVHYLHQRVYLKAFLTHAEYDHWNHERTRSRT